MTVMTVLRSRVKFWSGEMAALTGQPAIGHLTTQVMGVRLADSFGAALGDLLCVQDGFKFFADFLVCRR
jgi:hypothetical protein